MLATIMQFVEYLEGAEKSIHAGQVAWWYSWRIPPIRLRRAMRKRSRSMMLSARGQVVAVRPGPVPGGAGGRCNGVRARPGPAHARLVVIDVIVPEGDAPHPTKMVDLTIYSALEATVS